ncbi:MAG: diguanylate cyclase [Proteobacteria bacterium]|nr:diguanylate cyclase [Pseudomonadota bacterium]
MLGFRDEILASLRVRILGGIFLIFFLAMGMVLYGIWTYQRGKLTEITSQQAVQVGQIIEAGLRSSMLLNDRKASMKTIRNMLRGKKFLQISVLNKNGEIIMTSKPSLAGRVINKNDEPACRVCHDNGATTKKTIAIIDNGGNPFIRTITAIKGEPACYRCHSEEQKVIGILLIDSSLKETTALLNELAMRIALTGLFAFLVGVFFLNFIVTRFFTQPLEALQTGFEKVGRGDFSYWVEVNCGGEILHMADAFNIMSRAIGRYVDEVRGRRNEVASHYAIVQSLSQTIEKKKLKDIVLDLLCTILRADCADFALAMEKERDAFEIVSLKKGDKRHYHTYYKMDSDTCQVGSITRDDLFGLLNERYTAPVYSDDGSRLLIPIQQKSMHFGLISIVKPTGETFTPAERKIIPVLVHHITISFANAELYDLAITDGLTSLYTKRYFLSKINEFVENFHSTKRGFCVLILDLDHFKEVNDTYGHPVGDEVLVRVAELIRSNVRHGDIPCRYGGEEFIVLLKGDNLMAAVKIAERIRRSMEDFTFELAGTPPFKKTLSAGVACFPLHFCTADEIIAAADTALYQAKRDGRNQVNVYPSRSAAEEA